MVDSKCPLCGQPAESLQAGGPSVLRFSCQACGEYSVTQEAVEDNLQGNGRKKVDVAKLSWVTRELSDQGRTLTICSVGWSGAGGMSINEIIGNLAPRSVSEQLDRAVQSIERKSKYFGCPVSLRVERDWARLYAHDPTAARSVIEHLESTGLIAKSGALGDIRFVLTPKGWERAESLRMTRPDSRQGFIAMWFDRDMGDALTDGFLPAIRDAGYEPVRVDMSEYNGPIDDRVIAEIRRSKFVVADVTGHRQAVYFEAGFAMALGLPVIFTCRADHEQGCSFDTRQYNHIFWDSPGDLRTRLRARIEATVV